MDQDAFVQFLRNQYHISEEDFAQLKAKFTKEKLLLETQSNVEETNLLKEIEELSQQGDFGKETFLLSQKEGTTIGNTTLGNNNISLVENLPQAEERLRKGVKKEGRYIVLEHLGEGGMGVVQRVQDSFLGREVALKRIKGTGLKTLSQKQKLMFWRLRREAEITSILEHPNIVPLYDMQQDSHGELYFTMRKVQGDTLSRILKKVRLGEKILPTSKILSIFLKVCDAVAYAHDKGVVHRDLKPANVMVGEFGEVYVMDWGIAKVLGDSGKALSELPFVEEGLIEDSFVAKKKKETTTAQTMTLAESFAESVAKSSDLGFKTIGGIGTPGYMPPEQSENAALVTSRADIFALGKILRECFIFYSPLEEFQHVLRTRKMPGGKIEKSKRNNKEFLFASKEEKKKRGQTVFNLPQDILAIIEKATKMNPSERYQNVGELILDVERYQMNKLVSVRKYSVLEFVAKWMQRNHHKVSMFFLAFFLCFFFLAYSSWSKKSEKQKEFTLVFSFAKKAKELAYRFSREETEQKIELFLEALNHLNRALSLAPERDEVLQEKQLVGKLLFDICLKTQDYQLASYVAKEIKEDLLIEKVKQERTRTLTQHLARLDYWIRLLKEEETESWTREKASLEISKMPEEEIFQRLVGVLRESTNYFLNEKNKTSQQNQFYLLMIHTLGRLQNPKAAFHLLNALEKMQQKLAPLKVKPVTEINFMVALAQAIGLTHSKGSASLFQEIRLKMGQYNLFWIRTESIYFQMLLLEDIGDKKLASSREYSERGLLKLLRKEYKGALKDFGEALELEPGNAELYNYQGKVYYEQKLYETALTNYSKAIKIEPNNASYYHNRAVARRKIGLLDKAILDHSEAIRLNPNDMNSYNSRGNTKMEAGELEGAIEDFTQVIQINPQFDEAFNNRGIAKLKKGDLEGAIVDFTKTIDLNPQHYRAFMNRGNVWVKLKINEKAIFDFGEAIRLAPQYFEAYYNRGLQKYNKEDYDGAIVDYSEVIRLNPGYKFAYNGRANAYLKKKEFAEAIQNLKQALSIDPGFAEAYYNFGLIYSGQKKYLAAIPYFDKALQLSPNYVAAYISRGIAFKELKKFDLALIAFKKALQLKPREVKALINLGEIKYSQGKLKEALIFFTHVIEENPIFSEAYHKRAVVYSALGNFSAAIKEASKTIELEPEFTRAYNTRGYCKIKLGDLQGALKDYNQAIQLDSEYGEAYLNRGDAWFQLKEFEKALQDFHKASQLEPKNSMSYFNSGVVGLTQGHFQMAKTFFQKVLTLEPNNAFGWYYFGYCAQELRQFEEAIVAYQKGMKVQPEPEYSQKLADLLLQQMVAAYRKKEYQKAKAALLKFQKYAPKKHPKRTQVQQMLQKIEALQKK